MAFAADPIARALTNNAFMTANEMDVKSMGLANLISLDRTNKPMPNAANKTRKKAICKGWISGPVPFSKVVCNHLVKKPLALQRMEAITNNNLALNKPVESLVVF